MSLINHWRYLNLDNTEFKELENTEIPLKHENHESLNLKNARTLIKKKTPQKKAKINRDRVSVLSDSVEFKFPPE